MDDLKGVFDKIQKAESILNSLEKKRSEKNTVKDTYDQLSPEHRGAIDSARHTITSIKQKLVKELSAKTQELDKYQEELSKLQTRLRVGELTQESYNDKSRHLIDKIKILEKKVAETQGSINARFAEDVAPVLQSVNINSAVETHAVDGTPDSDVQESIVRPEPTSEVKADAEAATMQQEDKKAKAEEITISDAKVSVSDLHNEEDVEITRQKLLDALKIEPEEPELTNKNKSVKPGEQEEKSSTTGEAGSTAPKIDAAAEKHKPSFHLHPLREKPPDVPDILIPDHSKKNRLLIILVSALALALLTWGAIFLFIPKSGYNVGDAAPDFVMQLGDGNASSLSALRGKTVVIVFWDRDFWDKQFFHVNGVERRLYTPGMLNLLFNKYPDSDIEIIAIASGTNNNEIDKLIYDYNIKFPVIVDSFGKLRESYQIAYEPTYIFVDKNGIIRARIEGPIINFTDLEQLVYNTSKSIEDKHLKTPISNVDIQSVTEKAATINWTTEKPTSTQVDIDGKNIQTVITPGPQTLHSITLRDLSPATAYQVRIVYNIDNINVSGHSFSALADTIVSKRYIINTSNKDTTPPEISNISTGFITDSSITIVWKTDEPSTGEVDYSDNKKYSTSISQVEKPSIWHTVKIEDLNPDTLYYLKIRSKDSSGKETVQELEPVKTQNVVEIAPKLGKRAPDFTLYSIDGAQFTLKQFMGYRILLNFWMEGCPACVEEMQLIQTAYEKYSRDQLIILAVNVRGDPDKVSYFVAKEKLTFPVLMDTQGDVDGMYRAPYFPTSYFIDSKGIIRQIVEQRFQTISEIDDIVGSLQ